MKSFFLFILLFTISFIIIPAEICFPQDKSLDRVRTPESIPGWGTPLSGEAKVSEYYIAPGDEIQVSVWKDPDLSKLVVVRGDGKITYPLMGTVQVAGLTIEEFQNKLKVGLSKHTRASADYRLMPGDEIEIYVWKNADLSRTVKIEGDSKIGYPLIGAIQAAGLTTEELRARLKEELSKYTRSSKNYRIEPGDRIGIFVWKNSDISRTVKVRPDGKITYPLIGTIGIGGLSVDEAQDKVKQALSKYIKFPDVTISLEEAGGDTILELGDINISIKAYSDQKIAMLGDITAEVVKSSGSKVIIFGEVNNEGVYLYNGTINLLEAIAMAGGITGSGQRDSIIVVSGNLTDSPRARRVNLLRTIRKGTSKKDIILQPDDVIYVPRTFIADFNNFLSTYINPSMDTLSSSMTVFDFRNRLRIWNMREGGGVE